MKEMEYLTSYERTMLDSGIKNGYEWCIISMGTHPCAYVKLPLNHPRFQYKVNDYDAFADIECHGGITYVKYDLRKSDDSPANKGHWIGWDYNHYGDYDGGLFSFADECDKKWTTDEITEEVFNVIRQLEEELL